MENPHSRPAGARARDDGAVFENEYMMAGAARLR
jgi:hypothetical protein